MASSYTSLLKFNQPGLGDAGWGTAVNSGFTALADIAIAGLETVNVASGNVAMTIDSGVSGTNDARNMVIKIEGTLTVNRSVTVPASTKLYFVQNSTSGAYTVGFSTATGSGVTVPQGKTTPLRSDGTNIVYAFDHLGSLTLDTALAATSGGTGQTVYAVGDLLYASTTTALSKLTVGATNAVLTVAAGIPSWVTTLPVASGGTGAATLAANNVLLGNGTSAVQTVAPGTAGNVLTSVGGTWASAALPASYTGVTSQVFTSNGTFTIPSGVTKVKVTVVGAGGGSAGGFSNAEILPGGGGGTAIKWLTGLTPGNTLAVTVGSGGIGGTNTGGAGGAGGASSIASGTQTITTVTGNGGGGGGASGVGAPGTGGSATNGDINMPGSSGTYAEYASGYSILSTPVYNSATPIAGNAVGGGAGGRASGIGPQTVGSAGAAGAVIFEW